MVKKMLIEVQKKRPIKRNKKKLLKKVIDFLISDSYMFAPLISHPPHGFSSPMKTRASTTGIIFFFFQLCSGILLFVVFIVFMASVVYLC